MTKKIPVLLILGKSGAGKDTIYNVLRQNEQFQDIAHFVVLHTTRPARKGEVNHQTYHFEKPFKTAKQVIDFMETHEVIYSHVYKDDWLYYLCRQDLDTSGKKVNIIIGNPELTEALAATGDYNISAVYLFVPDAQRLIRQLQRSINPDIEEIFRRFRSDADSYKNIKAKGIFWVQQPNIDVTCIDEARKNIYWTCKDML